MPKRATIAVSLASRPSEWQFSLSLLAIFAEYLVQPHRLTPCRLNRYGLRFIKLACSTPAHHQQAVAVLHQPGQAGLGGDTRIGKNRENMLVTIYYGTTKS